MNAGRRALGCSVVMLAASCAKPGPSANAPEAKPSGAEVPPQAAVFSTAETQQPLDLGEILLGLTLVSPGSETLELDDAEVCEREGYPEALSEHAAAELDDARPGRSVFIVHDDGQTHAAVAGAGCIAPEEYTEAATVLELTAPAGAAPENISPAMRMFLPPYPAFVGAPPHPEAILADPPAFPRSANEDTATRDAIRSAAQRVSATHADRCLREDTFDRTTLPTADDVRTAADRAKAWRVPSPAPTVWAFFEGPALTFDCEPDYDPEMVGVLIDVTTNTSVFTVEANNGIELQWTTDLDGDGTHEALLDISWLEDGGHEIRLLHHEGEAWEETTLFVADGP